VDTLAALSRQEVPPGIAFETILVDNNSSDNTKEIAERFTAQNSAPFLRYFFESKQGLSHARNRGIAEAQGEFILFTDDDVSPESDWLATLYQSMTDNDCDGAGGWIGPTWEIPPPKWLTEIFFGFLAIRTDSGEPKIITAESEPPYLRPLEHSIRNSEEKAMPLLLVRNGIFSSVFLPMAGKSCISLPPKYIIRFQQAE
jgi:glycosyltransferase involved in cell wall biosynthesis